MHCLIVLALALPAPCWRTLLPGPIARPPGRPAVPSALQPDRSKPHVAIQDSVLRPSLQANVLACPVLLNLWLAGNSYSDLLVRPGLGSHIYPPGRIRS